MKLDELRKYARQESRVPHKELRIELMAKDPHCHWCGVLVNNSYPHLTRSLRRGEKYPNDMATIDHLYDRLDPANRYKVYKNQENKVLACFQCNQERSHKRVALLPGKVHQLRSELGKKRIEKGDKTPRVIVFKNLHL